MKEGLIDQAEILYKKAIVLRPNFAKAFNNLGNLYLSKSNYEKAKENFFVATKYDGDYFEAYTNLGSLYYKEGKIDSARHYWEKSININPEFGQAYYNFGVLYYNSKDYKKAQHYFNRAKQLGLDVNPDLLNTIKQNQ